jgi:hypothetical protein
MCENNNKIELTSNLYDKKPISWLIRELQKQLEQGNDYVEFTSEIEWNNTEYILLCSKS